MERHALAQVEAPCVGVDLLPRRRQQRGHRAGVRVHDGQRLVEVLHHHPAHRRLAGITPVEVGRLVGEHDGYRLVSLCLNRRCEGQGQNRGTRRHSAQCHSGKATHTDFSPYLTSLVKSGSR